MSPAEESRRASAEWFSAALAGVGVAAVAADARGRVVAMNPVAESLTGWPRGEAAGRPVSAVFRIENEQTRLPVTDPLAEVLAGGTAIPLSDHALLIARDGTERRIDHGAAPTRDAAGGVIGAVLIFCDVSRRERTVLAIEDARAFAESVVATVREPLIVLEPDLRVRAANRSFYEAFQVTPADTEARSLFDLGNRQWDIPRLRELLEEILPRDSYFNDFEVVHDFERIGRRAMVLNARRIPPTRQRPALILLAIEDATDRRAAAEALALSEVRYRRLFETAQDGILLVDTATGQVFDANPFLTGLLGYSRDELVGKELWEIGLFRDIESNKAAFQTLLEKGYIRYEDLPLRTHDGRGIEVEFVSNVYSVGDARVIQCNIRDITERKHAADALLAAHAGLEERVKERTAELAHTNGTLNTEIARREAAEADRLALQQQLATAQEDERRRIARELHDQLGQQLTALSLGLKVAHDSTPDPSPVRGQLKKLQGLTDLIGKEVHQLALELRPTALDDLGLEVAIASYAEEWSERSGVEVGFHATGLDDGRLPPPVETALYRVVQEALTNILKHARARRVSLVLHRSSSGVSALIEDDGEGFDPDSPLAASERRLGILGMQERVTLVGGSLTLESSPGRGTTVIARVPLPEGEVRDG